MVDLTKDVHSLTDFKRDTATFLKRMRRTRHPLVLTVKGKPQIVALDVTRYQATLDVLDKAEAVMAIEKGLDSFARGKDTSARAALDAIRAKHEIPR